MPIRLTTYRKGNSIPALPGYTIFNSTELFRVYELTRGYEPILIVAYLEERPVAKLLAVIRKSVRLFPPSIIKRCEIYGNGEYFDETQNREELFSYILEHLTEVTIQRPAPVAAPVPDEPDESPFLEIPLTEEVPATVAEPAPSRSAGPRIVGGDDVFTEVDLSGGEADAAFTAPREPEQPQYASEPAPVVDGITEYTLTAEPEIRPKRRGDR